MVSPRIVVTAGDEESATSILDVLKHVGGDVAVALPHAIDEALAVARESVGLVLSCSPHSSQIQSGGTYRIHPGSEFKDPRYDMEITLLRHALERDLPVLAICRGMQILNLAFGGTLQTVDGHLISDHGDAQTLPVNNTTYISPGSKLAAILGSGGFVRLSCMHNQGMREPQKAPSLLAIAYSVEDGVIEGLESPSHDWVIGVQCHPERKREVPGSFKRLFQAFVERAESRL